MEYNDDILIDRFLRGELTEDEHTSFQRMLNEEEGFGQRVKEMQELQAGVRESVLQEKRAFLDDLDTEIVTKIQKPNEGAMSDGGRSNSSDGLKLRRLWWLAAAAVFFIGAMIFWPKEEVKGPTEEYAYIFQDEEFEKTFEHRLFRSRDQPLNLSDDQIYAYNLYVDQQFEIAIPVLKDLWERTGDLIAYKYLGYSYLAVGENLKGEEIFKYFSNDEIMH